jgi:hypothetical protein
MKRYLLLLAISCLPFISRAGVKDITHADTTLNVGTARDTTKDGSSFEKAIVIEATTDYQGVKDEYAWLRQNYPGYKNGGQSLNMHNKKPFDILHITTIDGKKTDVYFDISKSFGKM